VPRDRNQITKGEADGRSTREPNRRPLIRQFLHLVCGAASSGLTHSSTTGPAIGLAADAVTQKMKLPLALSEAPITFHRLLALARGEGRGCAASIPPHRSCASSNQTVEGMRFAPGRDLNRAALTSHTLANGRFHAVRCQHPGGGGCMPIQLADASSEVLSLRCAGFEAD